MQTLSLPLMSAKWDYPISKYVFTVTLPKPFESYPAFTSGYHGDVISDYIDLDVSESRITGVIETGLKDHESLEMTLTLDKSYFSGAHTTLSFGWAGTGNHSAAARAGVPLLVLVSAQCTGARILTDAAAGCGAAVRYAVPAGGRTDPVQYAGLPLGKSGISDHLLRQK